MAKLPWLLAALLLCLGACLGEDVAPPTLCGNTQQSTYCDFKDVLTQLAGITTGDDCWKFCKKHVSGAKFASFYTDSTLTGEEAKRCICFEACDSLSTTPDKEVSTNFKLDACPAVAPDVVPTTKCGGELQYSGCDFGNVISGSESMDDTNEACQAHCNDTSAFPTAKFSSFVPSFLGGGNPCYCFSDCNSIDTTTMDPTYNTNLKECSDASTTGDPHLVGARGTRFDFNGDLGKSYCLLSDTSLHINALLGGGKHDTTKKKKTLSWMRELGLFWLDSGKKAHVAVLTSRRGTDPARGNTGFISSLTVDGATQTLPLKAGDSVIGSGGFKLVLVTNTITLQGGVQSDKYKLELDGVFQAVITVNPEIEANRCAEDAEVHFNLKIKDIQVSPTIHGILGQTFRPGVEREARAAQYKLLSKLLGTPVVADGESGAGFLDGSTSDYETSTVKQTDCNFAQGPWAALS